MVDKALAGAGLEGQVGAAEEFALFPSRNDDVGDGDALGVEHDESALPHDGLVEVAGAVDLVGVRPDEPGGVVDAGNAFDGHEGDTVRFQLEAQYGVAARLAHPEDVALRRERDAVGRYQVAEHRLHLSPVR